VTQVYCLQFNIVNISLLKKYFVDLRSPLWKNIVLLTDQGKAHMEKVMAEHQEILLNILKKLDRKEVEELTADLRRAVEIIERL